MTHYIQANTNGRLHDAREPSLAPLDRGFLYGDAIYEVWRTYHGVLFGLDEHWARLTRSAAALHMETGLKRDALVSEIARTAAAFRTHETYEGELYVRLQVSRGAGAIGLDIALAEQASWVLLVQRLKPAQPAAGRRALHLSVARELRRNSPATLNPAWKTGNYLNNLLCLREARTRGADEVVILNEHGAVSEAAVCNIFFARDATLYTPPLSAGILEGVTRRLIIEQIAPRAGLTVQETMVHPPDLATYSECFLTSSTRDIAPVAQIDDIRYACGDDSMGARLKRAFADYATEYARSHRELRV